MMSRFLKLQILILLSILISGVATAQSELRILTLGNSLTYGYYNGSVSDGNRIGYRKELYDLLNAAGYNFDFVGHQYTGFSQFPDAENGGTLGIKDEELADVMNFGYYLNDGWDKTDVIYPNQPYLNVYPADIILLHIGTNDWINDEYNLYQVDDLHELFDAVDDFETANNTEVLVIVAKIINAKNNSGDCDGYMADWRVAHYNEQLTTVVNQRIAAGDKVKLIDMQCGAGIDYAADMLNLNHPNQTGYDKMGQHWFDEIDNIHNAPSITPFSFADTGQGESFPQIDLDDYVSDDYTVDADIEWTLASPSTNYDVTISATHILTVTPKDDTWIGSEEITFIATDKGRYIEKLQKSSSITVTFNTVDINEQPKIIDQITDFNLNEDSAFTLDLSDLEIEDDDPAENWTLHIKTGDNYSFSGNTIDPDPDYDQQLLVNVTVSDLEEESEVFQVVANYNPVNDAPVINGGGPYTIDEDQQRTITFDDLDYEDPDNTMGELDLIVLSGSGYSVDGTTITPLENYYGSISVDVRLYDQELYSNTHSLIINVSSVNDAPVITSVPDTVTGDGMDYEYQIVASDVDAGDVLSYSVLAKPGWLTLDESSGFLYGTPEAHHLGNHPISLGVSDGDITTVQSFTLQVIHINTPPEFSTNPDSTADLNVSYSWTVQTYDKDDDDVSYFGIEIPEFLNFLSVNGILFGTPDDSYKGVHPVQIGATDGQDTSILSFNLFVGVEPYDATPLITSEELIKVFPNPAQSVLNVRLLQDKELQSIRIINIMGRTIHEEQDINLRRGTYSMDISDLPEGSYLLQVDFGDSLTYHKILVGR